MAKLSYFPYYPADFDNDTKLLSDAEVGAYQRLLNAQWAVGKIPFSKISRIIENHETVWPAIKHYFVEEDGFVYNKRLRKEWDKAKDKHSKAVASANARWNANADANAYPDADANSELKTQNLKSSELIPQSVLGAHTAFANISTQKPTNHELLQITQLCHQYTPTVVIEAIGVVGDHGWHSVGTLKKVLTGELPKPDKQKPAIDERFVV